MTIPNAVATIEHLSSRMAMEHTGLAQRWLERLDNLLLVEPGEVFPTHQLLDHIPDLILQVAEYLRAPETEEIAANTAVMTKAAELGSLRFDQRASVHQLLREYQILSETLEGFFAEETTSLGARADAPAAVRALSRATQAVRVLQQQTVDAFVTRYTETIDRQTTQLRNFSRLVSHEIRQPLGVLQVLSRIIPAPEGDPEAVRLVQTLERNVVRLADVAGKLERLARLTRRADNALNEQLVDLRSLTEDVATQLADMADARAVIIQIDEGLPTLITDAGRVELVLMNLLANAVKYSDPAKDPRIVHVRLATDGTGPGIQVADNGIGIPASKLDKIFEQFVRAHAHLDDELGAQGMGLGLAIVRECMDAMGGTVAVESEEGKGTIFTLGWAPESRRDSPPAEDERQASPEAAVAPTDPTTHPSR
jgi:signal transduction histidine kinase